MKKLWLILCLTLLLSLVLTACSSSGGNIPNTGGSSTSVNVTMTEFKFDPSTITVSAGKQVTVNLKNTGTVAHTFTVMSKPVNGSFTSADQANVLFDSGLIQPSSSKTVTLTAPSTAGSYEYICTVPGHLEAGMKGNLIVK